MYTPQTAAEPVMMEGTVWQNTSPSSGPAGQKISVGPKSAPELSTTNFPLKSEEKKRTEFISWTGFMTWTQWRCGADVAFHLFCFGFILDLGFVRCLYVFYMLSCLVCYKLKEQSLLCWRNVNVQRKILTGWFFFCLTKLNNQTLFVFMTEQTDLKGQHSLYRFASIWRTLPPV